MGSWEAPQDRESRSGPAFPGWPVVGLMRAALPVAGMTRRPKLSRDCWRRRQPAPETPQGGRVTTGSQVPPPSLTRLRPLPRVNQSLPSPGMIPPNTKKGRCAPSQPAVAEFHVPSPLLPHARGDAHGSHAAASGPTGSCSGRTAGATFPNRPSRSQ